jgi:hypothetical protein
VAPAAEVARTMEESMKIKMPPYISALFLALFLAGCTSFDVGKTIAQDKGAEAADEALDLGIWHTCQASTIGAVRRRFGDSQDTWEMYQRFCGLKLGG